MQIQYWFDILYMLILLCKIVQNFMSVCVNFLQSDIFILTALFLWLI